MLVEENRRWVMPAPRYLVGLATLFWGVMVEHELIGIALAFFFESHHVFKTRWNFSFPHYVKAWHLSVVFSLFGGVLYWMDGAPLTEMRVMFEWFPLIFSPLVFVQIFGERDSMPLNTFSVMGRYRMKADIREGKVVRPYMVNFTTPFFVVVLLAAGLKRRSANFWDVYTADVMVVYGIGLSLILGLFIFCVGRRHGRGVISFAIVYSSMLILSSVFLGGLLKMEQRLRGGYSANQNIDMELAHTSIGKLGELKLSKKVQWRMWVPDDNPVPALVPFTIYDLYDNGIWSVSYRRSASRNNAFERGVSLRTKEGEVTAFGRSNRLARNVQKKDGYRFLSTMSGNKSTAVMPHLNGYHTYGGLVGELANVERNPLGSVQTGNPDATLHCYIWTTPDKKFQLSKPNQYFDQRVQPREAFAIDEIVQKLGLKKLSDRERVERLRLFFNTQFKYTTHLSIKKKIGRRGSAVNDFLLKTKEGHCEYFATAAVLILRHCGMNARYVNGYSISHDERKAGAFLLRGDQAHAWAHVWMDDRWVDVDLTPADWTTSDLAGEVKWQDKLADWWKMWREDFQVWRDDPNNAKLVNNVIITVAGLVVVWIFIRLWFAKNKKKGRQEVIGGQLPEWKFLKKFDSWCTKVLGLRPASMTYGEWVHQLVDHYPEKYEHVESFITSYQQARFYSEEEALVEKANEAAKILMQKNKATPEHCD